MDRKKLKICMLLPDYYNPSMPARPAITEIYGKYLPSFGHEIVWISPSDNNIQKVTKEIYNDVVVYLIPYKVVSNPIKRLVFFLKHYFQKYALISKLLKNNDYDVIQIRNNVFNALIGIYFGKKYNTVLVFQYSFPKRAWNSETDLLHNLFNELQIFVLKFVLKNVDLIFPISKWMEQELIESGIPNSKMMALPMGVNPDLFSIKKSNLIIRDKYDLGEAKVLLYVGSMDYLRSLDVIIEAFAQISQINKNITLLMVGEGDARPHLEDLSMKLGVNKSIIFTGKIPYFEVPFYISAADLCLSPICPLDIYKVSSPTKLFEYMAMCKPVIANMEIPEQKEVVTESFCGVLVEFNAKSFSLGIQKLLDDSESAKKMSISGYKWVVENRSYETMALKVEQKYLNILESNRDN